LPELQEEGEPHILSLYLGGGFRFILFQHLQHKLVIVVHSRRLGKRPNTLQVEWGVVCEYAAAISGRAGGNLACWRPTEQFFWPVEQEGS
jgi:hypothetical protein